MISYPNVLWEWNWFWEIVNSKSFWKWLLIWKFGKIVNSDSFWKFKNELLNIPDIYDITDIGFKKLSIHQLSYSGLGTKSGGPLGGVKQESQYKIDCRWSPKTLFKNINKLHTVLSTTEFFAESFTAYMRGDTDNINNELLAIFRQVTK